MENCRHSNDHFNRLHYDVALELTAMVGFYDVVLKLVIFFIHERVWDRIPYGKIISEKYEYRITSLSLLVLLHSESAKKRNNIAPIKNT